jgi:hypothetical protein
MPFSRYRDRFGFGPEDMAVMQRVFDAASKKFGIAHHEMELRETLAAEIVLQFNRGAADEASLLLALSNRQRAEG